LFNYQVWAYEPVEPLRRRLNYIHRNHPKHLGVDGHRLQGAFLRIWDRSKLGTNDTTINGQGALLNAYDVNEGDGSDPEGYVGIGNIPEVANVAGGVHEPYLVGNRVYLAGYNSGARILELNGSSIAVSAYCRTEEYLTNDSGDVENFYLRPDVYMYAKGIYLLVPDKDRPGIVYGSDFYNGMWIFQYFDSTLVDTIRHIPFQESIKIGTIDANNRRTFHIAEGGAVIDSGSKVEFVDNTDFVWDDRDSLKVNGELHIGSVYFDSTSRHPQTNTLSCSSSGTVNIGDSGKTITGWLNIHVAAGGHAVIQDGTTLDLVDSSMFMVDGELRIESATISAGCHFVIGNTGVIIYDTSSTVEGTMDLHVEHGGVAQIKEGASLAFADSSLFLIDGDILFETSSVSDQCHFRIRDNGIITFDTAATITGFKDIVTEGMDSRIRFMDSSVVKMDRAGAIEVYGRIETPGETGDGSWCRIQSQGH